VKSEVFPVHAMKEYGWRRGKAPLFLNIITRWTSSCNLHFTLFWRTKNKSMAHKKSNLFPHHYIQFEEWNNLPQLHSHLSDFVKQTWNDWQSVSQTQVKVMNVMVCVVNSHKIIWIIAISWSVSCHILCLHQCTIASEKQFNKPYFRG
jgi:hypothetical protein